jgi:hypothetical protein
MRNGIAAAIAIAGFFFARFAYAEKVAVLPFTSGGNAATTLLDEARAATRSAIVARHDTLPSDSEMMTATMSAKDGVVDSSDEYRTAGRASGSAWTLAGHVEAHGATYRLELEACLVSTGRVESLAREIDPPRAPGEIGEMLALLIRPEGIANADIPWDRPQAAIIPKPTEITPPKEPPPVVAPPPPPPSSESYARTPYHQVAVGPSIALLGALARPGDATGSSLASLVGGTIGFAIPNACDFESTASCTNSNRLELRANAAAAFAGPRSFSFDVGARYGFAVVDHILVGPEATIGGFFPRELSGRFLVRGSAFVAWALSDRVELDLNLDLEGAPASNASLLLGGASFRALARF